MIDGLDLRRYESVRHGRQGAGIKTPLRPRFLFLAGLGLLGPLECARPAFAEDLAGYSVAPQFGHSSAPTAIAIAPNGRWFATAKEYEIYLWDMQTGEILRRIAGPDDIRFLALSKDGAFVLARDDAGKLWAWKAETGAPISAVEASAAAPLAWNDVQHFGEGKLDIWDAATARKYLSRTGIEDLVPASDSYYVLETNQTGIVDVDFLFNSSDGQRFGSAFIDVNKKKLLLKYTPGANDPDCGQVWGTFAFDGHWLVLTPTAKDASSFFSSAEVIDVSANPPKLKWQHYCRDFQVAGIEMRNGLILASPDPTSTTVYDPVSARAIARIADIGPTDDGGEPLAMSTDGRTIAYARLVSGKKETYGVVVLRDGARTFHPTERRISDVRLSSDGLTAFGATEAGWKAWKVDTGETFAGKIEPPAAPPDRDERREEASPDGKFRSVYKATADGRGQSMVVDAFGRAILTIKGKMIFSEDSLHGWSESPTQDQSIVLWDLQTGKRVWTATDDIGSAATKDDKDVLVMEFPDGRVRLSEGAEKMVRLVRGFHARPFQGDAKRRFLEP